MDDSPEYLAPRVIIGVCLLGLLCIYIVYYLVFNVRRPRVVCSDQERLRRLQLHCPALFEVHWPAFWAPQGHLQSMVRLLTQQAPSVASLNRRREKIELQDGGYVCLDWFNEDGAGVRGAGGRGGGGGLNEEKTMSSSSEDPIVLILSGMTGSSDECYVRQWIDDCNRLGYRSVVFNYRGCGKSKISTPKLFSLGDVEDLIEVADHIHSRNPSSTIVAVGVSMASVQFVRYVSECKRRGIPCRLSAILMFSVIWDLRKTDKILHNNLFNKHIFSRFLTRRYTNIMKENRKIFEENELPFDFNKAIKAGNLGELNESCVVHMFSYYGDRMQQGHSPCENVGEIDIPIISVNAVDDPFCPADAIPEDTARTNPNLILVTTRRGGHIGFMQSTYTFHKTYMNRIFSQFLVGVLEHNCLAPSSSSSSSSSSSLSTAILTNNGDDFPELESESQALLV